jgi:hypothetical protein
MPRARAALLLSATIASACSSAPAVPAPGPRDVTISAATSVAIAPASKLGLPLTGPPRLVIENHSTSDIDLYGAYIVDEEGKLATMALWPHPNDCPDFEPKQHLLPLAGVYDLAPPTRPFDGKQCAPTSPLLPGRYVVHIDSGYGAELYASAEIELPLTAPVRLELKAQKNGPPCTPIVARRAARLALAAAKADGAPESLLSGCKPTTAVCGTLPLDEAPPPATCTLTLHENLFRARFGIAEARPKELTVWLSNSVVFAQRPNVSNSTAAAISVGGKRVVFEGLTAQHWHVHGGDAARVGSMQVRVFNDTGRALPVKVTGIEWQTDHSCGTPASNKPSPPVTGYEPKTLPPGTSELTITFNGQGAYQAHCDMFASRATLVVDNKTISIVSEHEVGRFEPLDPSDG